MFKLVNFRRTKGHLRPHKGPINKQKILLNIINYLIINIYLIIIKMKIIKLKKMKI